MFTDVENTRSHRRRQILAARSGLDMAPLAYVRAGRFGPMADTDLPNGFGATKPAPTNSTLTTSPRRWLRGPPPTYEERKTVFFPSGRPEPPREPFKKARSS